MVAPAQSDRERLTETRAAVARLMGKGWGRVRIARELEISEGAAQRAMRWNLEQNPFDPAEQPRVAVSFAKGQATGSLVGESFCPQDPEDALEKANIDPARYEVTGGKASSYPVTLNVKNGDGSSTPQTVPQWGINVQFRRRPFAVDKVWEAVLADIRRAPPPRLPKAPPATAGNRLLEVCTPDLHVGKWSATGNGPEAARERCLAATEHLLRKAGKVGRVLLVIGNDLMHVDTEHKTTTRGTPQDVCLDPLEMFTEARRLLEDQVAMCAGVAPVDVEVIPGNHGRLADWHLAHVIDARYHGSKRVRVNLGGDGGRRRFRSYYRWGDTLLGFCHGSKDDPKPADLPRIMAEERPDFASAVWREWQLGHEHREMVRQVGSVMLRWAPSLSVTDGWHWDRGYIVPPAALGIVYDKRVGMDEAFMYRHAPARRAAA